MNGSYWEGPRQMPSVGQVGTQNHFSRTPSYPTNLPSEVCRTAVESKTFKNILP